jgi:hypothetical protein
MAVATKTTPRRSAAGKRRTSARHLPESAAFTRCDGREFVLLPVDDLNEWIENQIDYAESKAVMAAEGHLASPLEDVIGRLSARKIRPARKGK